MVLISIAIRAGESRCLRGGGLVLSRLQTDLHPPCPVGDTRSIQGEAPGDTRSIQGEGPGDTRSIQGEGPGDTRRVPSDGTERHSRPQLVWSGARHSAISAHQSAAALVHRVTAAPQRDAVKSFGARVAAARSAAPLTLSLAAAARAGTIPAGRCMAPRPVNYRRGAGDTRGARGPHVTRRGRDGSRRGRHARRGWHGCPSPLVRNGERCR